MKFEFLNQRHYLRQRVIIMLVVITSEQLMVKTHYTIILVTQTIIEKVHSYQEKKVLVDIQMIHY